MYDENTNRGLDGEGAPDEYKSEEQTTNFILRDQEESAGEQNSQNQTYGQTVQSQQVYQGVVGQSGVDQRTSQSSGGQVSPEQRTSQSGAAQASPDQRTYQGSGMQSGSDQRAYQSSMVQAGPDQRTYQSGVVQSGSDQRTYQSGGVQPGPDQRTYQGMGGQPGQGQYGWQPGNSPRMYNWENGEQRRTAEPKEEYTSYSTHTEKKKRSGGIVRKIAGITAAALLFGTVSGGTMVGINMLAGSLQKEETYPQVGSIEMPTEAPTTQAIAVPSAGSGAGAAVALDVSDIVEKAMPSVVAINNTMIYEGSTWFGQRQQYEVPSSGSGIIVGKNDDELLIVTNNHVVEDSSNLSVVFIDDNSISAIIKGTDAESDLAVIAVPLKDIPQETLDQISIAKLGNSAELKVGQGVVAIGNALGYGQSTTVGYISALDREVTTDNSTTRHLLQTDAAINPGNSGGALLNMRGEVIGINAAKYSRTDVEGIGYAIPVSEVQDIIDSLMVRRSTVVEEGEEGYLGIQGLTVDESMVKQLDMPAGVFVYSIIDGGAAAASDLREKDVITKFDGQSVKSMAALQDLLKRYKAGETIELTVQSLENGKYVERSVFVTLGKRETLGQERQ